MMFELPLIHYPHCNERCKGDSHYMDNTTAPPPMPLTLLSRPPLRWRLWWRFGFRAVIAIVKRLPIDEWRQESWIWHVDIWAMDHIGRQRG